MTAFAALIDLLGPDHVLFGSDWPHGEGRKSPRHFDAELEGLRESELERILRTNTASLLGL